MSRENVEVIRNITVANDESDFERALGHLADDVVLEGPAGIRGGTFRGREAVAAWSGELPYLFRLREGKVTRMHGYLSQEEALKAAGLSEASDP